MKKWLTFLLTVIMVVMTMVGTTGAAGDSTSPLSLDGIPPLDNGAVPVARFSDGTILYCLERP